MNPDALRASRNAAWRMKIGLLRYRAFRHAATVACSFLSERNHIYVWPPFTESEEAELQAIESHIVHYLHNLNRHFVLFQRNHNGIMRICYDVELRSITSRSVTSESAALDELRNARYCIKWKYHGRPQAKSLYPWNYNVAEGPECNGTVDWLRLVSDLYHHRCVLPKRPVPFSERHLRTCAILGTGPSLDHFMSESERWDAWIGTNSIVCDERIWNKGRPFAYCILDPYSFGPTYHSKSLWEGVFKLLRESPAVLVTGMCFAPYIELNFPDDIKRKCHYVKMLGLDSYRIRTRFDSSDLAVTPYGNVLTDLMLPLASSITRNVILYGCDGRPPDATMNFPKAAGLQRFDDEWHEDGPMYLDENIYSEYIQTNGLYTRYVVAECLKLGVQVTLRSPSWNEGLNGLPVYSSDRRNDP